MATPLSDSILLTVVVFVIAVLLQAVWLRIVKRPGWLAQPNERSSHTQPTPTMGGLVFVLVITVYLLWLGTHLPRLGFGLAAALGLLGLVGLADDLWQLSARIRFVVHFATGALVLWALGFVQASPSADPFWWWLVVLPVLVWLINLYNFMDGIDGIAAAQCLVFCIGVQCLSMGVPGWSGQLIWVASAAVLAFLCFNWPPAGIFMGDVGSSFLGLLLGGLVLWLWQQQIVPLVASLILLAAFWFDATYTLCVRIVTRQPFTQAHRSHLYQRLAQRRGHLWTTCAFLLFALIWLMPLAWLAQLFPVWQLACLALAVLPLGMLCWRHGAGLPEADLPQKVE